MAWHGSGKAWLGLLGLWLATGSAGAAAQAAAAAGSASSSASASMVSTAQNQNAKSEAPHDSLATRVAACTACHGLQGRAATDGYYPRIAGKPAGYLFNQLQNFRDGRRQYPLMTYMVQHLPDRYLQEIADHFASQHPPYPPPRAAQVSAEVLARGQQLAQQGDPAKQVPACAACHGQRLTGLAPAVPGLLGVPRDYLSSQFGAWQNGVRRAKAPDCMAEITKRLSGSDIAAVSAWLAAQPVPADPLPMAAGSQSGKLPLDCGSTGGQP